MTRYKTYRSYRTVLVEDLRAHPDDMQAYLEAALESYTEDGDEGALLLALRTVAEAQGGIGALAEKTHINRQSLYKALSPKGNPRLKTIGAILHGLGYELALRPTHSTH